MRRVIITEFSNLSEKLTNQCVIFSYRLKNLCIKAEPASLLPIKVNIDGQNKNLEECACVGKGDDDYTFKIVPLFEEDLRKVALAIRKMPVVNDNRYDALKNGVKMCYDKCKVEMDAIYNASKLKFDKEKLLETKDDQDKLDNLLEKVKTKAEEQREKIYNNKLQEIEEAHSKWAEEHLFES